jgi:TolB-like protein
VKTRVLVIALSAISASFAANASGQSSEKKVVAVLPFESPNRSTHGGMGHNAQPTFMTELVKSKKVRVVDDKRLKEATKRFEREMTGLFDQKKLKQLGQFLKADYIVSGQVSATGDAFTMTVHVTNVETLELEMAEDVDFRNVEKMRLAVRASAKKIADLVSGGSSAAGKHEAFFNIDARHFYDTAEACIDALKRLDAWRYEGEVDAEDPDGKTVHVAMKAGQPKAGMPLQVFEAGLGTNDTPIGVVYVVEPDERGRGFVAKWIKEKDKTKKKRGEFGLGARVSNARYKYRIAVGALEDEAEDNAKLVEMFRDKLLERMDESSQFIGKNEPDVLRAAVDLGRGAARKKKLEALHLLGVDFVLEGKFIGDPGQRRADFKVISAATGEEWGRLKFETRI